MLSNAPITPRPKPPAIMRRSLTSQEKTNDFPPPPYETPRGIKTTLSFAHNRTISVSSVGSTINSPVAATAQLFGIELEASKSQDKAVEEDYVNDKSRDELAKLLLKAESVIRARERELGVAAAVGKQLLDTNLHLRQRHESLLSKYPGTPPASTPSFVPFPSNPASYESDHSPSKGSSLPTTLHAISQSLSTTPSPRPTHSRRMSASPQVLAALSDQNFDLLAQMQQLQDETSRANLEGKRKLRQLEKEIAGLRGELEVAQERNGQLEERIEKVQTNQDRQTQEQLREKGRLRFLQGTSGESSVLPDFAPAHPLSAPSTPMKRVLKKKASHVKVEDFDSDETQVAPSTLLAAHPSQNQSGSQRSTSAGELAVLGQLLEKIEELEQANRDIIRDQRERDEQLRRVTQEADTIKKIYDDLEDEVGFGDDEEPTVRSFGLPQSAAGSWRRSLPRKSSSSLRIRSLKDRGSPVSSLRPRTKAKEFPKNAKVRKPLSTSLFEHPESPIQDENDYFASHDDSAVPRIHLFGEESGNEEEDANLTRIPPSPSEMLWPSAREQDLNKVTGGSVSRRRSRLRPKSSTNSKNLRGSKSMRSLQSELGREFGDDWGSKDAQSDFIFSEYEQDQTEEQHNRPKGNRLDNSLELSPSMESSQSFTTITVPADENPAVAAIREALEPRNYGKLLDRDQHILPVGSLVGSPGETFFLLSHAVQSRPNVWRAPNADRVRGIGSVDWGSRRGLLTYDSTIQEAETGTISTMSKHVRRLSQALSEDPWEEHQYPDTANDTTDIEGNVGNSRRSWLKGKGRVSKPSEATIPEGDISPMKPLERRAAAQSRLERTASRRVSLRPGLPEFDDRARALRRVSRTASMEDEEDIDEGRVEDQPRQPATMADNLGQTLMELWIILQAGIILMVFIYSMARRGPRAILDAADVKRRPNPRQ